MAVIRRRFCDLAGRQIHYRTIEAGGPPLLALHHLPGSSRQIEGVLGAMKGRRVIAPDLAGLGDSDPHPLDQPTLSDYALDLIALLDALGLDRVDVFGSHTGAALAVEMAVSHPDRIDRVVIEGVPLYDAATAAQLTQRYAPYVQPDPYGAHLIWIHNFCRDQILFSPWYDHSDSAARGGGLPPPAALHLWVLEVIKGMAGFPLGYRAVFGYPMAERLSKIGHPTLCISAAIDTLADATRRAAELVPNSELALIEAAGGSMADPQAVAALICGYLDRPLTDGPVTAGAEPDR